MKPKKTRAGNKPEIVIRHSWYMDACGKRAFPVPEILILANRKGLLWLADWLRDLAHKKPSRLHFDHFDPDDHQHVGPSQSPGVFNRAQSDEVEIRLGILTGFNRREVFRKYGGDKKRRLKGSALHQYETLLDRIRAGMEMERTRIRRTRKSRLPRGRLGT